MAEQWNNYRFIPDDFIANENSVAVYGTYYGVYKKTGKTLKARVVHIWKLYAGKIVSFEQFVDSKVVEDVMH